MIKYTCITLYNIDKSSSSFGLIAKWYVRLKSSRRQIYRNTARRPMINQP